VAAGLSDCGRTTDLGGRRPNPGRPEGLRLAGGVASAGAESTVDSVGIVGFGSKLAGAGTGIAPTVV